MSNPPAGIPLSELDARCDALIARERERTGGGDTLRVYVDPSVIRSDLKPKRRRGQRGVKKPGALYRVRAKDGRLI